jgi:preprotein translocase subunit SecD
MMQFQTWKVALIAAILAIGTLLAVPNLIPRADLEGLPSWLPKGQITLGLDLQGGSHLLLEVGVDVVIKEQLNGVLDGVRSSLRKASIGYTELAVSGNAVTLKLRDPAQYETARESLREIGAGMVVTVADDGAASLAFDDAAILERKRNAVAQSIEIVRRRIDETGVREPTIVREGEDRILIQLPGVKDPEAIKSLLGQTAKMTFRFVDESVSPEQAMAGNLPPTDELLPSTKNGPDGKPLQYWVVQKRVMVSGENLVDAQATFQDAEPVVSFRFDSIGAKRFGDATRDNVGKLFAIVLDNKVISAPVIRDAILTGSGIISGSFTTETANELAILLRAGALPAPLTVLEERTVGAELGADSIAAGKIASAMGLALICVALLVCYGLFGIFANIALIFNFVLLIGAMSALQATLTLPGIAGMVLSLGMAVDANVLIHERIREEIRAGRGPVSALDAGYRSAAGTITDSNLTVIISAMFLYIFGSGTVKGFAVTLIIGTIVSMFTAVMVARLFTAIWVRRFRPQRLPI